MKNTSLTETSGQNGFVAALSMILMFILILLGLTAVKISASSYLVVSNDTLETHAQLAADAGIQDGIQYLSANPSWTAPSTQTQLMDDTTEQLRTTYQLTVTNGTGLDKILRSTGRTFRMPDTTNPVATRTYEVILTQGTGTGLTGDYAIIAGAGGLEVDHYTNLKGNIYVSGRLKLSRNASITPGSGNKLQVAGNGCRSTATPYDFPVMCATDPITVGCDSTYPPYDPPFFCLVEPQWATTDTAYINGTVSANNQINTNRITNPGLTGDPVGTYPLPPPPDRQPIKDAITVTMLTTNSLSPASENYCTATSSSQRVLPANVKITGNLVVKKNCPLVVSGNAWVTGSFTLEAGGAIVKIANSVTQKPIVMIDGILEGQVETDILPNSSGIGGRFISYKSSAPCSPECTTVPGTTIENDVNSNYTISLITLQNAAQDLNYTYQNINRYTNSEFMAAWSTVQIIGSQFETTKSPLAGQRVTIGGVVTHFDTGGNTFTYTPTSGGSGGFSIKSHRRVF